MKSVLLTTVFLLVSCTSHDTNQGGGPIIPPPPVKASVSVSASASAPPNLGGAGGKGNYSHGEACCPFYDEGEQACYGPTNCTCSEGHHNDAGFSAGSSGTCCSD